MNQGGNQGYSRGSMQPLSSNQQQLMGQQQQGAMLHGQQQQQPMWSQRAPPISSVANQQRLATNMMPGNRSMGPVMMSGQPPFATQQQHVEMQAESHMQNQHQQQMQQHHQNTVLVRHSGQTPHAGGSQRMSGGLPPMQHSMQQQQQQYQPQQQMMGMQPQEMQQQGGMQQPPPVYSSQPPPSDLPPQMMQQQHGGMPPNALQMQQQQQQLQNQQRGLQQGPRKTVEDYRSMFYRKLDALMKQLQIPSVNGKPLSDYEHDIWNKYASGSLTTEETLRGYINEMKLLERNLLTSHQHQQSQRANAQQMNIQQHEQQMHGGRFVSTGMPSGAVAMQGPMPTQQQQQGPSQPGGANPIDALQKMTGDGSAGGPPRPPGSYDMQQQPLSAEMQPTSGVRVLMSPPQQQLPTRFMPQQQQPFQQSPQLHALVAGGQPLQQQQPAIRSSMLGASGGPPYTSSGAPPPQHLVAQPPQPPQPSPNAQLQHQQRLQHMLQQQQQQQQAGMRGYAQRTMLSGGGGVILNQQQQNPAGLAPQFRGNVGAPMMMGSPAASVMSPAPTPPTQQLRPPSLAGPPPSSSQPVSGNAADGDAAEFNYRQKLKELADRYLGMVQSQSMSKTSSTSIPTGAAEASAAKLHQLYLILSGEKKVDYNVLLKCERVLESFHERVQSSQQQQQQAALQQPATSAASSAQQQNFMSQQSPAPSSFDAVKIEPAISAAETAPILSSSRAIKQEFMPPSSTMGTSAVPPPIAVNSTTAAVGSMPISTAAGSLPTPPVAVAPQTAPSPPAMYIANLRQPRIEVKRGEIGAKIMETLMNATNSIMAKRRQAALMSQPVLAGDDFGTWMTNEDDFALKADASSSAAETKTTEVNDENVITTTNKRRRKPVAYLHGDQYYSAKDNDDETDDDDDDALNSCDAELADLSDDVLSKLGLCLTYDEFEIKAPRISLDF